MATFLPHNQPTHRETTFWLNALNLNHEQSSWQLYIVITQFETKSHVYVIVSCNNQTCIIPSHILIALCYISRSWRWGECAMNMCVRCSCTYLQSACESTLNGFSSAVLQMWLRNWKHEETTLHGTASVRYTVEPLLKNTTEIRRPWLIRTLDCVPTLYKLFSPWNKDTSLIRTLL